MRPVFAVSLLLGVVSAAVSGAAAAAPVAVRVRHVLPRTAHGRWPHRRLGNGAVLQQPALSQQLFTVPSGPADGFFVVISGDNDGSSHSAASGTCCPLFVRCFVCVLFRVCRCDTWSATVCGGRWTLSARPCAQHIAAIPRWTSFPLCVPLMTVPLGVHTTFTHAHTPTDDLARLMSFMASELPDATGVHHPGELFAVPQLVQRPVGMLRGGAFPAFSRESGDFHAPVPMDLLRVLDQVADQAMHDLMAHPSAVHVKFHCGADPASDVHEEGAPAQEAPSADGTGSCRADVATHCPNNVASLYETLMCLHSVKSELSIGCQRLLEDDPTVVGHCYDDIATQCAGVSHGHGRIHACLLSHSDALSASCSSVRTLFAVLRTAVALSVSVSLCLCVCCRLLLRNVCLLAVSELEHGINRHRQASHHAVRPVFRRHSRQHLCHWQRWGTWTSSYGSCARAQPACAPLSHWRACAGRCRRHRRGRGCPCVADRPAPLCSPGA